MATEIVADLASLDLLQGPSSEIARRLPFSCNHPSTGIQSSIPKPQSMEATMTPKYLTVTELGSVSDFVQRGTLEIRFDDDLVTLWAAYQAPEEEGTENYRGDIVGMISFRKAIGALVDEMIERTNFDEGVTPRDMLHSLAGQLREAVRFVESKAESLTGQEWAGEEPPRFQVSLWEDDPKGPIGIVPAQ
jgi:hypothetical protein